MRPVRMYTKSYCGYCFRAKALFEDKGVAYEEIDVTSDHERYREMVRRSGGVTTVPQIFIDGQHIGGYDDTARLDRHGELDLLLAGDKAQPKRRTG